ncbi:MAG: F-type H+-transporting ATPase subunit gamma [Flammeovirgaceae bacterium]|jgi:F-type H+-transporting ATPase subunit gamma
MPSLKEVKARITSIQSTQQITKAMKMVAAAKLRKAQNRIEQIRPYSKKLTGLLDNITATLGEDDLPNTFGTVRAVKNVLVMVVTSDRGLCGGFNTNANKAAMAVISKKYNSQFEAGNVEVLPIGTKGRDFFKRREQYSVNSTFATTFSNLVFEEAKKAAEYAMDGFLNGQFDAVELVYNEFKNVATQVVKTQQFLPAVPAETPENEEVTTTTVDYIFEPSKEEIVAELIPKALKIEFYKALLESNASEQGARMTAMDKATENAEDLLKELKLTYNRTRQAYITTEILEIVGGAEALSAG